MCPVEAYKQVEQFEPVSRKREVMYARHIDRLCEKIIQNHEKRPDLYDFSDIYQKDEIKKDTARVAQKETGYQENLEEERKKSPTDAEERETTKKLSEAMEILVVDFGELYDWFGEEAYTSRTTKFDDYFNGVDLILQFGSEDNPIALSLDVTSAKNTDVINKKIDLCRRKAFSRNSNDRRVKYFESPIDQSHGSLDNVIPLVVGFESSTAMNLVEKAADIEDLKTKERKNELDRRKLDALKTQISTHPAQMLMLSQITAQLNFYVQEAKNHRGLSPAYIETISKLADKIESIYVKKIDEGIKTDHDDEVLHQIKNKIKELL